MEMNKINMDDKIKLDDYLQENDEENDYENNEENDEINDEENNKENDDENDEEINEEIDDEMNEEINDIYMKNMKKIKNKKNNKKSYIVTNNISKKHELLLTSLINFYLNKSNLDIIVPIIRQQTILSLRLLDWLVTNYSKKHNICYSLSYNNDKNTYMPSNKNFNLWMDYKNQLKAFSKRTFDPFCRRERIVINLDTLDVIMGDYEKYTNTHNPNNSKYIVTTVGQLNFFRWAILNKVLDYAYKNKHLIDADMLEASDKRNKSPSFKRQLSKNNHSSKSHELKILIEF